MQFSIRLALFAAAVSALPQHISPRQEPGVVSPQEAAHMALKAAGLRKGEFSAKETAKIIPVIIGGQQVTMVPDLVMANVGDVIQFQFANGNHTVTQSSETAPCQPLQATLPGAMHSGHIPFKDGQTTVGTFNMPVLTTEPMFIYCATGPHCQLGQVMIVNPKSTDQVVQYTKISNQAKANVDAQTVAGGTVAQIPLAQAAFVPAPAKDAGKAAPAPAAPAKSSSAAPAASKPAASSSASIPATSKSSAAPAATKPAAPPAAPAAPPAAPPAPPAKSMASPAAPAVPSAPKAAPPAATPAKSSTSAKAAAPAATPPAVANPAAPGELPGTVTTTITVTPGVGQIPASGATPVAPPATPSAPAPKA